VQARASTGKHPQEQLARCLSWFPAGKVVGLGRTGSDEAEAARGDLRRRACVSVDVCVRESAW
jgi:hypothetical protein